jgi:catechol 2,3-dioxygenase-like lactoylglutathione lyase family enzyme
VIKLAHVCIESSDLEATERYYACLGLRRQFEFRNRQGMLVGYYLRFDDRSFIEVIRVEAVRQEGAVRHFAIEADDLDAVRQRLIAAGFDASERRLEGDHAWMVTSRDPNGVYIEVQQYSAASLQLRGGVCTVDYVPRPRAAPA